MDKLFKNKDIPVKISFIYDNQTIYGTLLAYSVVGGDSAVGSVVKVKLPNGQILVYPFKDIKNINFTSGGGKRKSRRNRKSKKTKKSTRRNRKSKKTKKSTRRKR